MAKTEFNEEIDEDWTKTEYVDSFATLELAFPMASVIGLRLHDSNQEALQPGHKSMPFRFRLSAGRARELAKLLIDAADEIEGVRQQRQ